MLRSPKQVPPGAMRVTRDANVVPGVAGCLREAVRMRC